MSPRRRWRWALPLFLLAVLLACEASGWFFLRAPAEAVLASRAGREVHIAAPFRLHFRRTLQLEVGGLWIAAPEGFPIPHLIDADRLRLSLRYGDLAALRRPDAPLRVVLLAADRFDARLVRLPDGRASWQFAAAPQRPPPVVEHMGVQQGEIILRDPSLAVDVGIKVATQVGDGGPRTVADIAGQLRDRPLRGSLSLPAGLPRTLPGRGSEPVAVDGQADFAGVQLTFAGTVGVDDIRGQVTIKGPSLGLVGRLFNTTLPTTAPFSLQGEIVKDSPLWQITISQARIGASDLAATFTYDAGQHPPRLEGELRGRNLVLADLMPALGTRNEDGAVVRPARGRTLPDRKLDLPSLSRLNAVVAVHLERVDLGSAFRLPIAPLRARLTLEGGRLALAEIDARTAQGRLAGALTLDPRPSAPQWRAELAWDDIHLDSWLRAAKPAADDIRRQANGAAPPPWFTGTLHGRSQLVGQGRSVSELLASVDGRTTVFVRNGTLSHLALEALGLDVAQSLGLLLRGDDRQPMECAVIDLQAKDGRLTPRVGLVATPVTVVLIDGSIDLAAEQLDLRLTAKPQNVSPLTVRSPLRVRGSFAAPRVAPEGPPIAVRAAGALGLALLNPLAAILPFVDFGDRDTLSCQQALAATPLPKAR
ncbi:MAG TPA: AsmA family protein [Azonexus sp.]